MQRDGHLPTDASTRLHFSRDELSTYLESEDGQSRAARTRLQWAKLLEAPTLLVVALRRGRRVAQLGPRSPDYLSEDDVYASLADLRSRRLAEMAAHCVEIQISGAPRHRRDVVPVTASARWRGGSRRSTQDNLTHWLISTQVDAGAAARLRPQHGHRQGGRLRPAHHGRAFINTRTPGRAPRRQRARSQGGRPPEARRPGLGRRGGEVAAGEEHRRLRESKAPVAGELAPDAGGLVPHIRHRRPGCC